MRPQNMLYASLFAAGLGLSFSSAACASAVVIAVDKTSQRMTVSVDGATRYVWPVSTGRPGFDTPNGTFHPFRLDRDHHSTVYDNAPMPDSIFFTRTGDAVHGFFDTPHLGQAVSHGCVRLSPANAAVLYELVEQTGLHDTTVIVGGRIPQRNAPVVARRQAPQVEAFYRAPDVAPDYGRAAAPPARSSSSAYRTYRPESGAYRQGNDRPQPAAAHDSRQAANDDLAPSQGRNFGDQDGIGRLLKSLLNIGG